MTLDSTQIWTRRQTPPDHPERLLAMIFNNFWFANFVAEEHGLMEFQFDLVWRLTLDLSEMPALAEALVAEPVVLLNQGGAEDPILIQRLFNP